MTGERGGRDGAPPHSAPQCCRSASSPVHPPPHPPSPLCSPPHHVWPCAPPSLYCSTLPCCQVSGKRKEGRLHTAAATDTLVAGNILPPRLPLCRLLSGPGGGGGAATTSHPSPPFSTTSPSLPTVVVGGGGGGTEAPSLLLSIRLWALTDNWHAPSQQHIRSWPRA